MTGSAGFGGRAGFGVEGVAGGVPDAFDVSGVVRGVDVPCGGDNNNAWNTNATTIIIFTLLRGVFITMKK